MAAEARIDRGRGRLTLPYLMKLDTGDFGGRSRHVAFAVQYLPADDARWVRDPESFDGWVEYGAYDWTIC